MCTFFWKEKYLNKITVILDFEILQLLANTL